MDGQVMHNGQVVKKKSAIVSSMLIALYPCSFCLFVCLLIPKEKKDTH